MAVKEFKCGHVTYKISAAPLKYISSIMDYTSIKSPVPYELKLQTMESCITFKDSEESAWQKLTEDKLNIFCDGMPHLFKALFDLACAASATDDQKKIEEFSAFAESINQAYALPTI